CQLCHLVHVAASNWPAATDSRQSTSYLHNVRKGGTAAMWQRLISQPPPDVAVGPHATSTCGSMSTYVALPRQLVGSH
ncbi:hypothetical protein Tco_0020819, partial [Tanacetum coccineum]